MEQTIEQFTSTMNPMQAGRATKTLTRAMRINGEFFPTVASAVSFLLTNGYTPIGDKIQHSNGSFFRLNKTATKYAEFLNRYK